MYQEKKSNDIQYLKEQNTVVNDYKHSEQMTPYEVRKATRSRHVALNQLKKKQKPIDFSSVFADNVSPDKIIR